MTKTKNVSLVPSDGSTQPTPSTPRAVVKAGAVAVIVATLAACAAGTPDAPPSQAEARTMMLAIGYPQLAPPPLIQVDPEFSWKWPNDNAVSNPYIGVVLLPEDWRHRGGEAALAGEFMEYAVVRTNGSSLPHNSVECAGAIAAVKYATAQGKGSLAGNLKEAALERFGCSFAELGSAFILTDQAPIGQPSDVAAKSPVAPAPLEAPEIHLPPSGWAPSRVATATGLATYAR